MGDEELIREQEHRVGWIAYEEVGIGSIHLEDMIAMGAVIAENVNGQLQYRLLVNGEPSDVVYYSTPCLKDSGDGPSRNG